jgi:hypothetical protein
VAQSAVWSGPKAHFVQKIKRYYHQGVLLTKGSRERILQTTVMPQVKIARAAAEVGPTAKTTATATEQESIDEDRALAKNARGVRHEYFDPCRRRRKRKQQQEHHYINQNCVFGSNTNHQILSWECGVVVVVVFGIMVETMVMC